MANLTGTETTTQFFSLFFLNAKRRRWLSSIFPSSGQICRFMCEKRQTDTHTHKTTTTTKKNQEEIVYMKKLKISFSFEFHAKSDMKKDFFSFFSC
jgi:hypothetical protein